MNSGVSYEQMQCIVRGSQVQLQLRKEVLAQELEPARVVTNIGSERVTPSLSISIM